MSGGASDSSYPLGALALVAGVVAAVDFVLASRGAVLPLAAMCAGIVLLAWRAWLAARSFGAVLTGEERRAALAQFYKVPVSASLGCLLLGLALPWLAQWTGVEGSVATLRGRRTIEYATDPALFWFTTACWYAVSVGVLWFGAVFAWSIERLRRDPRRVHAMLSNAGR